MKPNPKASDKPFWVIRAGQKGAAHKCFIEGNVVALADAGLGDLQLFKKNRRAFYAAYAQSHPDADRTAVSGIGGKFFRFTHEMQIRDLILYPCIVNDDRSVYFGVIIGPYSYKDSADPRFPHWRKVRWEGSVPKHSLSNGAKRELGAARTLFRFKRHAQEIHQLAAKAR